MSAHEIFYFPYGYFEDAQTPLLKMAALYFDKLYLLDPELATSGTIGISAPEVAENLALLEQEPHKILERVNPKDVVAKYENAIANAVHSDMADPEFLSLCESSGRNYWTLALAKVPKEIRDDPRYRPTDRAMQRFMGDLPRSAADNAANYVEGYRERLAPLYSEQFVYDEYREREGREIEYRYADYPVAVGESIMVNHALFAGLLHSGATPLTDDPFHHQVLAHKIERARRLPEIGKLLEDLERGDRIRQDLLTARTIRDRQLDLPVMSPNQPLDRILQYRQAHKDELAAARNELGWLAREIRENPWTKEFDDEIHRSVIPQKVRPLLQSCEKARNSWLKYAGMAVAAAAATVELLINPVPLLSTSALVGVMAVTGDHVIPAADEALSWRRERTARKTNGLHYLVRYKAI